MVGINYIFLLSAGFSSVIATAGMLDTRSIPTSAGLDLNGSSTTQTGFNSNGTQPSPSRPLGNPSLPGWTSSGGLNWVGFDITEFNSSITLSYNFAVGGATTDADLIPPYTTGIRTFVDQVVDYKQLVARESPAWTRENLLVGVWIGNNDVGGTFGNQDAESLYAKVLDRYFEQLEILHACGVNNFVLLAVGPQHETPLMREKTPETNARLAWAVETYNNLMRRNLKAFKKRNRNVKAWMVVTAAAYYRVLNNLAAFGLPDATCTNKDGVSCAWWDNYHPGIEIHHQLGIETARTVGAPWFRVP
ncbi:fungal cellulose binding domain-containing protein [Dactylonectria macrodidyma]|uniref:Fungal cellulose binding domain-containing protein n=1 Tax=Dactylonectria macrodidyma TaxID=307937 RepID=A0A9P9J5D4_9HYPO|nr:fungal cellulose binding domain-containing protein [Dactylonectria macrodidyma]